MPHADKIIKLTVDKKAKMDNKKSGALQTIAVIVIVLGVIVTGLYFFAPIKKVHKINRYTGQYSTRYNLWRINWGILYMPEVHTIWAKKHLSMHPPENFETYEIHSIEQRGWFGDYSYAKSPIKKASLVERIYELNIPEDKKVGMFHEYDMDLSAIDMQGRVMPCVRLIQKWDKKLKAIK